MNNRQCKIILVVGARRTRKTTLVNNLVKQYRKRVLIVAADDSEPQWLAYPKITINQVGTFSGKKRIIFDEDNPMFFRIIRQHYSNGMLVCDDSIYYQNSGRPREFVKMFIRASQRNVDLIDVTHGLSEVQPFKWTFADILILKRTNDGFERSKEKIANYDKMRAAVEKVNRIAKQNPFYHEIITLKEL